MITVIRHKSGVTIRGHAQYAPHGSDIVCAAISALAQTFIASVEELTTDEIQSDMAAGNVVIEYGALSAEGQTLLASFFVGVRMIAEAYPDHVRLTKH